MMYKAILPDAHDAGKLTLLKKLNSGRVGVNDLASLVKQAGHMFAEAFKKYAMSPGEIPIHLIALGATESVGPNRNGDGFEEEACINYHDTFVKHAKWYRNHKNKNPSKSYGVVKMSMYNPTMRRIELLVALNGTKEAADRNNGLIADEELERLESGQDIPVSMSCKVAYDVCSGCGNKAKTRHEYCIDKEDGGECEFGGLKHNIGVLHKSGHHLHARNPHPTFFDISKVIRGADRTAFVMGKAASCNRVIGGAELAEIMGITAPAELDYCTDANINKLIKLAREMSDRESKHFTDGYGLPSSHIDLTGVVNDFNRSNLLKALATEKIALSLTDWLQFVTLESTDKCAEAARSISPYIVTAYRDLVDDESFVDSLQRFSKSYAASTVPGRKMESFAIKQSSLHSLERNSVMKRAWSDVVNSKPKRVVKSASDIPATESCKQLAKQYVIYQLQFLNDIGDSEDSDFVKDNLARWNKLQ